MTGFVDERRFVPAVREWRNNSDGPTRQWATHQQESQDRAELARLLHAESWPVHEIAQYLGCGRAFVVQALQEGLW